MEHQPTDSTKPDGEGSHHEETGTPPGRGHLPITIVRQYLKDISFENPNAPQVYRQASEEGPELHITIDLTGNKLEERTHEVVLSVNLTAKIQDTTAFLIEVQYAGVVTVKEGLTEEQVEQAVMVETPRYLFPFLRATVADMIREGGFPPLLLSPIDFQRLHRQRRRAQSEAAATGE